MFVQNRAVIVWLLFIVGGSVNVLAAPSDAIGPGGRRFVIDKPQWKDLETKVIRSLVELNEAGHNLDYDLIKINSAEGQIVNGNKFFINALLSPGKTSETVACDLELLEEPSLDYTKVLLKCNDQEYRSENSEKDRAKRSLFDLLPAKPVRPSSDRLIGGPTDVDASELPEIESKVAESLVALGQQENGPSYTLNRIVSAKKQVVAGILYHVTAEFGDGNQRKICTLEIWEKPWSGERNVDIHCDDKNFKVSQTPPRLGSTFMMDKKFDLNDITALLDLFHKFKMQFKRQYSDNLEQDMRFNLFKRNLFLIEQLRKFEGGTAEYDVTEFADMTLDEFFLRTGLKARSGQENHIPDSMADIPDIELPASFDWRDKNAVTSVKNQGQCGSCWAFSVTGNIEGLHAAKNGTLEAYSEQELLDCDDIDGACNGGLPDDAYKAIERIGGLETETEYPYHAKKEKCQYNPSESKITIKGSVDLPKDEVAIAKYLVAHGPVSIGINANAMQFYRGGISHPWKTLCKPDNIDHGVLLVGYGVSDYPVFNKTMPYWIIKNSWGPEWGEQGYYRLFRGENACGVTAMASSAVLD